MIWHDPNDYLNVSLEYPSFHFPSSMFQFLSFNFPFRCCTNVHECYFFWYHFLALYSATFTYIFSFFFLSNSFTFAKLFLTIRFSYITIWLLSFIFHETTRVNLDPTFFVVSVFRIRYDPQPIHLTFLHLNLSASFFPTCEWTVFSISIQFHSTSIQFKNFSHTYCVSRYIRESQPTASFSSHSLPYFFSFPNATFNNLNLSSLKLLFLNF